MKGDGRIRDRLDQEGLKSESPPTTGGQYPCFTSKMRDPSLELERSSLSNQLDQLVPKSF